MRTSSHQSWHPEGRVEQYEESYFVIEEVYGAIRDAFLSKWEPRPHYYYDLEYILSGGNQNESTLFEAPPVFCCLLQSKRNGR